LVKGDAQPCVCGRNDLALVGGILGRTDDMVVVRGVNVYPSAVDEIIRGTEGVLEYRVQVSTVQALTELSLEIEPKLDWVDVADLKQRLEKSFQAQLALRIPVKAVASGELPRFEMKARRWVRVEIKS
jgi:phenylacetate-CoA ligase